MNNKLFIGDNLSIMRSLPNESIDLIATDIPFNSGRSYSSKNGIEFDDRWSSLEEFIEFMKLRLIEMHRLLKETGSVYVHCDQSASHYLKVEMDKIFGVDNFKNDIVWCYAAQGKPPKNGFPRKYDNILFYTKSNKSTFNREYIPLSEEEINKRYRHVDENGKKFYWYRRKNKIYYNGEGIPVLSWWTDIKGFGTQTRSKERIGYPTQKPMKLYQRIIKASSNEGDLILDPFCGSGTTLDAAQLLNRNWIGIDKNPNTIDYIKNRFNKYGLLQPDYEVIHE